ncbi:MAG: glycosyltransferase, partial [Gemmataceae bacterium]
HCYLDPTSGAALSTRDLLTLLTQRGWACGAFTGPWRDDRQQTALHRQLQSLPDAQVAHGQSGELPFTMHTYREAAGYPVTIYSAPVAPSELMPCMEAISGFRQLFEQVLQRFRPDVILCYGGDPASQSVLSIARSLGNVPVFWLHNFAYSTRDAFQDCRSIIVPSAFAQSHYQKLLGVNCQVLPTPIEDRRVRVEQPQPKYCTFVNPEPAKGVFWLAKIAEFLSHTRPDIPLLIVEGRGSTNGLDIAAPSLATNAPLFRMPNTADPREFYRLSKIVLVPSLWNESFGRVAVEALLNGIPVLASDRGALPEILGGNQHCLPIPVGYKEETRQLPTMA